MNDLNAQNKVKERKLVTINVGEVLAQRLGRKRMRYVPRFAVKWLEGFIRQRRLNELLEAGWPAMGVDFCRRVLSEMDVSYDLCNPELLPEPGDDSRVIFVSNHPLGGLDGMILSSMVAEASGTEEVRFVVNDLLAAVEPLSTIFLPVNKHGRQNRASVERLNEAFAGSYPVIMFPAGLVSRLSDDGVVRDLRWQKMFVNYAVKYQRDIVPLRFIGENSSFFYKFARLRKRLGISFNIEMIRLPAELVRAEHSKFTIAVGQRIPWTSLSAGREAAAEAESVRQAVYGVNMDGLCKPGR